MTFPFATEPSETDSDTVIRSSVAGLIRRRQKQWFVVIGMLLAAVIAALLMGAVGTAGGNAMPSLHYDPSHGFTFNVTGIADADHFDTGDVLLPGGGTVSCAVGESSATSGSGALSCDWSSFVSDHEVSARLPTPFMRQHGIVSGRDAGQWCVTATDSDSTAGAPSYQVDCGTAIDPSESY
ncbi:hypothetical protein [Curtobacterium sp. MCBD17_040]|uniref:hypothetical protein n=1 Tax=Curtobacterium sp. MCBD17_040 TaxID=2175674 RepID=UPI000DA850E6|nr:hypothetical protein [Curtobacterium sp. MCBD17_040]WIB65327.1 hypothetical protein DEI94_18140 [Curtobacterium sp. MCBD17_040]